MDRPPTLGASDDEPSSTPEENMDHRLDHETEDPRDEPYDAARRRFEAEAVTAILRRLTAARAEPTPGCRADGSGRLESIARS